MADEIELKAGDVVQLKSGGPSMTIAWVQTGGEIGCHWWNEAAAKIEFNRFEPASLKVVNDRA